MNPEIRFRVQPEIYQLAEQRAHELGLSGPEAGRSAGVPLLARAALYQWLGLPWPGDLPQPHQASPAQPQTLALPQPNAGSLSQALAPSSVARLTVQYSYSESYRQSRLEETGEVLPRAAICVLSLDPQKASRELRRLLRLDTSGQLQGWLQLPELECEGPLTPEHLEDFLRKRNQASPSLSRQAWEHNLASWSQSHGSELLRARLEEGFSWLALAEKEWMTWRLLEALGESVEFEELRAEQSLAHPHWVHALYPDREPDLERIQLLRVMRGKTGDISGLRLSLVGGTKDHVESRKRTSSTSFKALLWQLETPTGSSLGLLSHQIQA